MMTTQEVAEVCHVRTDTVKRWAREGAPLKGKKIKGQWLFDRDAVDELLRYL